MALYRIAKHPKIRKALYKEIDQIEQRDYTEFISYKNIPYLDSFIKEVLRLDSSISIYGRDTTQTVNLRGYNIPRGSLVLLSQYGAHRLEKSWKNPESFDPLRFHPEYKDSHHPKGKRHLRSYFPFGVGQRSCIGRNLAEQEVKIFLIEFLRDKNLHFEIPKGFKPKPQITMTTRLNGGLPVTVI